jgi:hypothetical protein
MIYQLTKVKKTEPQEVTTEYVKVGQVIRGTFPEKPQVGNAFLFIATRYSESVATSTVMEVDSDVEPGITYITTRNSVYKLEESSDA